MMVTNGNVQVIVHRRLQRIIDIIVHKNLKTVKCLTVRFLSSSYSAIAISLDHLCVLNGRGSLFFTSAFVRLYLRSAYHHTHA